MPPKNEFPVENGQCVCKALQWVVDNSEIPIEYSEEFNEYQVVRKIGSRHGRTIFRFCPFCGKKLPESRRK